MQINLNITESSDPQIQTILKEVERLDKLGYDNYIYWNKLSNSSKKLLENSFSLEREDRGGTIIKWNLSS